MSTFRRPLLIAVLTVMAFMAACGRDSASGTPAPVFLDQLRLRVKDDPQSVIVLRGPVMSGVDQAAVEAQQTAIRGDLVAMLGAIASDDVLRAAVRDETALFFELNAMAALREAATTSAVSDDRRHHVAALFVEPSSDGRVLYVLRSLLGGRDGSWQVLARGYGETKQALPERQAADPATAVEAKEAAAGVVRLGRAELRLPTSRPLELHEWQRLRSGETYLLTVPCPNPVPCWVAGRIAASDGSWRLILGDRADAAGAGGTWRAHVAIPGPDGDGNLVLLAFASQESWRRGIAGLLRQPGRIAGTEAEEQRIAGLVAGSGSGLIQAPWTAAHPLRILAGNQQVRP
ncbi:hypothetical protein LBMAG53_40030 [Planctomycetota bacterium]|nr:hypothetical protein LBMAG53_40030 [Planctomycetota bacterium]